jgi:hypothetical protein
MRVELPEVGIDVVIALSPVAEPPRTNVFVPEPEAVIGPLITSAEVPDWLA